MTELARFHSKPARDIDSVSVVAEAAEGKPRRSTPFPVGYHSDAVLSRASARWERDVVAFAEREPVPPRVCYKIGGATCMWPSMVVVGPDSTIIRETAAGRKQLRQVPGFSALSRKRLIALAREGVPLKASIDPPEPIDGDFFLLASTIYDNYFHWLIECLPKVALWRQTGDHRALLCPPMDLPFQRSSLELAGVPPERIVEVRHHVRVEGELLFSDRIRPGYDRVSRSIIPFFTDLRTRVPNQGGAKRRLFVSRSGARVRRLSNEAEIIAALNPLGFELVRAEDLSFADQMVLYASAEMIVAPHGAGLANIAICRPGTIVVELTHDHFEQPGGGTAYAALADFGALRYGLVVGAADTTREVTRDSSFDFAVGPAAVLGMIEQLAASPST